MERGSQGHVKPVIAHSATGSETKDSTVMAKTVCVTHTHYLEPGWTEEDNLLSNVSMKVIEVRVTV